MGLDSIVRQVVSIANSITKDLQPVVEFSAWEGFGDNGEPVYAMPLYYPAIVEYKQQLRENQAAQEVMQKASVTFIRPIPANGAADRREPIDPRDKIVLPSGYTGPILDIKGIVDPTTGNPYMYEVFLG